MTDLATAPGRHDAIVIGAHRRKVGAKTKGPRSQSLAETQAQVAEVQRLLGNDAVEKVVEAQSRAEAAATKEEPAEASSSAPSAGGESNAPSPVATKVAKETAKKASDEMAKETLKADKTVDADNATSAFSKLAPVLDFLCPDEGMSAELDVELRVNVKGGFVGIHLTTGIARSATGFQISGEAKVSGGAHAAIFKVQGEIGVYLELQGPDAKGTLVIASWYLYRQLRESNFPRELVNLMYDRKSLSSKDWEKSVEDTYFSKDEKDKNNYAEGGVLAGIDATAGVKGIAHVGGGVKVKAGRVYDAESIERRKGAKSLTQRALGTIAGAFHATTDRGAQASLGDRIITVITSLDGSIAGTSGTVSVTSSIRQEKDKRGPKTTTKWSLDTLSVDAVVKLPGLGILASAVDNAAQVAAAMKALMAQAQKALGKAKGDVQGQAATNKAIQAGDAVNSIHLVEADAAKAVSAMSGVSTKIPKVHAGGQLHLTGGINRKAPGFAVLLEGTHGVSPPDLVYVSIKAKRVSRVASLEWDGSSWTVHVGSLTYALSGGAA